MDGKQTESIQKDSIQRDVKPNIIGCFYDCDETLIPDYMQHALFNRYGIDSESFWKESNAWCNQVKASGVNMDFEMGYLNHLLKYQEEGKIPSLSNALLREVGKEIKTFPGLPDFFSRTRRAVEENTKYRSIDIKVEHYIISTGLKEMVLGSPLNSRGDLKDVFAAEFAEEDGKIKYVGRAVGHMKKTEFLHLTNKGSNLDTRIDVNRRIPSEGRRIPFDQMIYVGDGLTDVPCFALVKRRGGYTFGVYNPQLEKARRQANELLNDQRVMSIHPADYREGSEFSQAFEKAIWEIAEKIYNQQATSR